MLKNNRFFLYSLTILSLLGQVKAQKTAVSPYSSFGYGDYKMSSGVPSFGMGGLSSAYLSTYGSQANFENPAANTNLRYTDFSFEGALDASQFKDNANTAKRSTAYISKVSLAFPMGEKWRGGIGFQPFSTLGYNVLNENTAGNNTSFSKYTGQGAINTLQAFTSYNITKELALGLKASYIFGNLSKEEVHGRTSESLLTGYDKQTKIKGFNFTTGIFYSHDFNGKNRLSLGLNYGLGGSINAEQQYKISTYGLSNLRKYNEDIVYESNEKTSIKMPQKLGVGISYGEDFRWNIGAQFDWEQVSKYSMPNEHIALKNRLKTSIGGFIIPNINSYKNYLARVTYRAGAFYEKTPISINGNDIDKYGITFGLGLPVGKPSDPSEINFGIELGQQGTEKNNLIKENFANFKLSFTLNDSWFQQRKYN